MAVTDSPIPGADAYQQVILAAQRAYQEALARLNQRRADVLREFGYRADINPETGVIGQLRVDPGNQFGLFQNLLFNNAVQAQRARDALVGRGIFGGLLRQADRTSRMQFGQQSNELATRLQNLLGDFQSQQTRASNERDMAITQAQLQAARDAIEQQRFNEAQAARQAALAAAMQAATPEPDFDDSRSGGEIPEQVSGTFQMPQSQPEPIPLMGNYFVLGSNNYDVGVPLTTGQFTSPKLAQPKKQQPKKNNNKLPLLGGSFRL